MHSRRLFPRFAQYQIGTPPESGTRGAGRRRFALYAANMRAIFPFLGFFRPRQVTGLFGLQVALGVSVAVAAGTGIAAGQTVAAFSSSSAASSSSVVQQLDAANLEPRLVGDSSSLLAAPSPAPRGASVFPTPGAIPTRPVRPFSQIGIAAHVGLSGAGFDTATPLSRHFNLRTGADFFSYADSFTEQGANVDVNLRLRTGHAMIDWFPFRNGFHVSPMVNFGDNNAVRATVLVPAGSTITLSGTNYISSLTDPLHGSGSVGFRKTSPGLTVGWGNIVPRSNKHLSFPVELGFYYQGQPTLKVAFTGSACDPSQPAAIGCESVTNDASFQQSLTEFTARNNHNLSYASFFPVLSTGIGYSF
jgi:hypothetical protein